MNQEQTIDAHMKGTNTKETCKKKNTGNRLLQNNRPIQGYERCTCLVQLCSLQQQPSPDWRKWQLSGKQNPESTIIKEVLFKCWYTLQYLYNQRNLNLNQAAKIAPTCSLAIGGSPPTYTRRACLVACRQSLTCHCSKPVQNAIMQVWSSEASKWKEKTRTHLQ